MDSSDPHRTSAGHHYHPHLHNYPHHHHHICRHHHLHSAPHHHHLCHHYHHLTTGAQPPVTADSMFIPMKIESKLHLSTADTTDEVLTQREVADEEGEELDGDDPILAMTDEWKEFFAKSEARRRLEKQQMKNKHKKKYKEADGNEFVRIYTRMAH